MRLSEVREVIAKNSLDIMAFEFTNFTNNNTAVMGFMKPIQAVRNIAKLGFLEEELNELIDITSLYNSSLDKTTIDSHIFTSFHKVMSSVSIKVKGISDAIDHVLPKEEENSLNVKLPDYSDLKDISEFFRDIDFIFRSTITSDLVEGKVEVVKFESGSMWVGIALGSQAAVTFIGNISKKALVIQEQYYKNQMVKKEIEKLDLLNNQNSGNVDTLKIISDAMEKQLELIITQNTKMVIEEEGIEVSNEKLRALERSLGLMAKLYNDGMKITPSLNAGASVKEEFPSEPSLIDTKEIKLLKNE